MPVRSQGTLTRPRCRPHLRMRHLRMRVGGSAYTRDLAGAHATGSLCARLDSTMPAECRQRVVERFQQWPVRGGLRPWAARIAPGDQGP